MLTLAAICLFGQLAVPGLVCAQAYADDAQSDLELGFAFDSNNSALLFTRQELAARSIRASSDSADGPDSHPTAWIRPDPAPLPGMDEPFTHRLRHIVPTHNIHGPPLFGHSPF